MYDPRRAIFRLKKQIAKLKKEQANQVRSIYVVGCLVDYVVSTKQVVYQTDAGLMTRLEDTVIFAKVTDHAYGTDIFIQNMVTGKVRRVDGASESLSPHHANGKVCVERAK